MVIGDGKKMRWGDYRNHPHLQKSDYKPTFRINLTCFSGNPSSFIDTV